MCKCLIEINSSPLPGSWRLSALRIQNITSSQTFANFGFECVILKAGKPLGIYGCNSPFSASAVQLSDSPAVCSSLELPAAFSFFGSSGRAHINMQLFCIFRSPARFLFIRSCHLLRRCGLTHISPCLWRSRLLGGDSKLTFTQRCWRWLFVGGRASMVGAYLFMRHIYLLIHIFILIYMHNLHLTYFYEASAACNAGPSQEKSKFGSQNANIFAFFESSENLFSHSVCSHVKVCLPDE